MRGFDDAVCKTDVENYCDNEGKHDPACLKKVFVTTSKCLFDVEKLDGPCFQKKCMKGQDEDDATEECANVIEDWCKERSERRELL